MSDARYMTEYSIERTGELMTVGRIAPLSAWDNDNIKAFARLEAGWNSSY